MMTNPCLINQPYPSGYRRKKIDREFYMGVHALLNLLNDLGKRGKKCKACQAFYCFFTTSLINSIIQEHK